LLLSPLLHQTVYPANSATAFASTLPPPYLPPLLQPNQPSTSVTCKSTAAASIAFARAVPSMLLLPPLSTSHANPATAANAVTSQSRTHCHQRLFHRNHSIVVVAATSRRFYYIHHCHQTANNISS
jgi:hypothetical protein